MKTRHKKINPLDCTRVSLDVDTLDARAIDVVAYWQVSACAVLDDEIDWDARDGMPLASPVGAQTGYFFTED